VLSFCLLANAQEVELKEIAKSGFERPGSWVPNAGLNSRKPGGLMQTVEGGRSGKCLEATNTPTSNYHFRTPVMIHVDVSTDTIQASVYVKGKGSFRVGFYCYDRFGNFVTTFMKPTFAEVDSEDWIKREFAYDFSELKQGRKTIAKVFIAFEVGENSALLFDDFSAVRPTKAVTLPLAFAIDARDAGDIRLIVNGEAVKERNSQWPIGLREGLNIIGMTAMADGNAPGLRLRVPGQPELAGRWRVGVAADGSWLTESFDDRSWGAVEPDKEGYLGWPEGSAGRACFRQIVLWGKHHYTGLPCIQPKVREWGFSEGSMETLFHPLYTPPPLGFPLEDYELILDVPKGFKLLEQNYDDPLFGGRLNCRPEAVATEEARHHGQPYTRYRFAFRPEYVRPFEFEPGKKQQKNIQMALIPLVLGRFSGAGTTCRFYFRRLASGNLTEIEQQLPVRVLPPINGRTPKKVAIQQYCAIPWRHWAGLSTELFESHMRQSFEAGFNYWIVQPWRGEHAKRVYDRVLERGGAVGLWGTGNYPLWRNSLGADGAFGRLMLDEPEARARYFNDGLEWTVNRQFCRSFVTGKGAAAFKAAVRKDIALMLHGGTEKYIGFPKAYYYFVDWEQLPWQSHNVKHPFCFCQNCKNAFRRHAKLPATTDLTDDAIRKNHKREWSSFRHELDGRVNGIVREVCGELGLRYMYYDMVAYKENWPSLKGNIDIAFPGLPGGDVCYGNRQAHVDRFARFLRDEVGLPRAIGQQFAADYNCKHPWDNWKSRQEEFFRPQMLKTQILRIVAATHGGIDLNCSFKCFAGMKYYIGEATRLIAEHEDLFWDGERDDDPAVSEQIEYPNLLVLRKGDERLVLLFNEGTQPLTVQLRNKSLKPGQKATIYYASFSDDTPAAMEVTIAPEDVEAVHIK